MFCAALTVSIFGAEFKEGTYVGEPKGYRGEIKVEVKIKPAAKSKIRRHLCPNKKALITQGLL